MPKSAVAVPRSATPRAAAEPRAARSSKPRRSAWQWVRAIFSHQLRLRRGPRGLAFVLEEKAPAAEKATPVAAKKKESMPDMRRELGKLLDAVPDSRKALRHLAAVEKGLRKDAEGLFLFDVAIEQLHVALRQLASLGADKQSPGLAALSTRLLDAIAEQEKRAAQAQANGSSVVSSFLVDEEQVDVAEVEVSRFEQMFAGAPAVAPKS
jgi:hypothetical protein